MTVVCRNCRGAIQYHMSWTHSGTGNEWCPASFGLARAAPLTIQAPVTSALARGVTVRVNSPGHRMHDRLGTVTDGPGMFMGTWTVRFEHLYTGTDYGFWASELTIIEGGRTTDPLPTEKGTTP